MKIGLKAVLVLAIVASSALAIVSMETCAHATVAHLAVH